MSSSVPNIVLRGCVPAVNEEVRVAFDNYLQVKKARLTFSSQSSLQIIFEVIEKWFLEHGQVPGAAILEEALNAKSREDHAKALAEIMRENPRIIADQEYVSYTKLLVESESSTEFSAILEEASEIASVGRKVAVKEGGRRVVKELRGTKEAAQRLLEGTFGFLEQRAASSHTMVCGAVNEMREEYLIREASPEKASGIFSGFESVDMAYGGWAPGDVVLIAGFAGNGKSTMAMNMAHEAMVLGYNGIYFSLEMDAEKCRRSFVTIHAAHPMFENIHKPLLYDDIRKGTLEGEARQFYFDTVLPDLENPNYGEIKIDCPTSQVSLQDLMAQAEILNRRMQVDFIVLDYIGLVEARSFSDYKDSLNLLMRQMKQWAMTFDGGRGVPIISPFQCNRKGYEAAKQNSGVYDITALSHASEAERTADAVYAIYSPEEERSLREATITNLKSRDSQTLAPFKVYTAFESKYFAELNVGEGFDDLLDVTI